MDLSFIWQALLVLFVGFCLLRIVGKKTVSEMTGLEIITLLAMASVIGHAISGNGIWKTIIVLSLFVSLLIAVQFLSIKFNSVEKLFIGKATPVIIDGQILTKQLKKLRLSVDQLEAKLREKGITAFTDVKTATIEVSGELGFELMKHAKPVTMGELENLLVKLQLVQVQQQNNNQKQNLFDEVIYDKHKNNFPSKLN